MLELYRSTDPLVTALWGAGAFALVCWVLSLLTKEYSWVDRLWSITPPLFAVHFAAYVGFTDARLNLMAALTVLWGVRLTYNFARKGGYKPGGEDYNGRQSRKQVQCKVLEVQQFKIAHYLIPLRRHALSFCFFVCSY